ncbi:Fe-S cluster assembly protein SufD [Candidatus Woesearchaeota archaeon]|nr:Fe-S cluster assembly protein SufD [Candidatus Woesearchaeota archaeon]
MESKNIEKASNENKEPKWLADKRLSAYELFKKKPMPDFIYGLNINLNIDLDLDNTDTKQLGKPARTVINKSGNAGIFDFNEILDSNESLLEEKFMTEAVPAADKFTLFHQAFVSNILLVHIPKNTEIKEPIEIISKINSKVLFDHLIIVADDNSKAAIVEKIESENNEESYVSKIVEIFAGNNSKIDYGNLQMLDKNAFQFTRKRAVAGKDALINWLDCNFGSNITLSEVTTSLNGEGSATNNYGIFFGNESQQLDLVANSIHNAPNTVSDIFTKGALTDKSKCIYRGLVKIQRNASGSNGYQKEDTLLLSPEAAADSIPDLEIDNSDVRCTHGASIGRADKEKLFYLKSRGLNEKEATQIYVRGFFEELIQKMKIEKLRDNMHDLVEERMK